MNDLNREEAKRWYRQNELRILKDQWFQQDLREAEMKAQLDKLPLLPNLHKPLFENGSAPQNRQKIKSNFDLKRREAEWKTTEFKRKMRTQQFESLQKSWFEQDIREAKALAEAERIFRDLNGLTVPF